MTFISCRQSNNNSGSFIQYCITMIAGVLTTMFFFFPVIRNLLQGKGVDTSGGWIIGFHAGIRDILKGSFVLTVPYTGQGLTFFCGSVVLLSMIGYFLFSKRKYKERIWSLGYLIFLIFCTVFIPLENIWNGFRKSLLIIAVFPLLSVFSSSIWQLYFYLLL